MTLNLPKNNILTWIQDLKSKVSFIPRQKRKRRVLALGLALLIFLIPLTYLTLRTPEETEAAWFDDSYGYRQPFSFTHNADISTERAITFSLDTAELITAGVMQSDCDDTRFTNINGLLLRYELTGTCNNAATTPKAGRSHRYTTIFVVVNYAIARCKFGISSTHIYL